MLRTSDNGTGNSSSMSDGSVGTQTDGELNLSAVKGDDGPEEKNSWFQVFLLLLCAFLGWIVSGFTF